jgi:hypothetical protein
MAVAAVAALLLGTLSGTLRPRLEAEEARESLD